MTIEEIRMKCANVLDSNPSEFDKAAATALILATSKFRIIIEDNECRRAFPCAHCTAVHALADIQTAFDQ